MRCEDLLCALNEYLDGELDEARCAFLDDHLMNCEACHWVVVTTRHTIAACRCVVIQELPTPFRRRLRRALQQRWTNPRFGGRQDG